MSKQSYEDVRALLVVVRDVGPITAIEMATDFKECVKRGFIGSDGRLTEEGRSFVAQHEDRGP